MVSRKSWEKFKRDVEDLTKTGVERESWGKKSTNKDQNDGYSRKHRISTAKSHAFQVDDDKKVDNDIKGFSSSDDDDERKTMREPVKPCLSVSKRALCHSAPVKRRKRLKTHEITPDVNNAPVTRFQWRTFDSLRNRQLDGGSNKPKTISSNFESSFTVASPSLAPENTCLSSANFPKTKSEDVMENRNKNEEICWSDSEGDSNSEHEEVIRGVSVHTKSHNFTSHNKMPFSSQQMDLSLVEVKIKPAGDIDEFVSDSEDRQLTLENTSDKELVPSISPNTPTPTPTSPAKVAEGGAPLDSAKKRKPKYLRSGLAERLHKLILREHSEKSFWSHKLRQLKEGREEDDQAPKKAHGTVTLRVVSDDLDHSVHVIKCDVISQDVISERQLPVRVTVLLDNDTRKQLEFKSNPSYIRIYSPWKIFDLPNSCLPILLAITHCEVLSSPPLQLQATSSSTIVEEPVFSKQTDQSQSKVIRTRLFASAGDAVNPDEVNNEQGVHGRKELEKKASEDTASCSSGLLDVLGLQGQCLKDRIHLTGRIQRVYWQDIQTRDQKLNCTSSLVTSILERSKVLKKKSNISLCFLVQDSAGFCSEIRVFSNVLLKRAEWQELLCTAEGSVMSFGGLRLVEHRKRKRRPGLFGLIDSLSDTMAYKEGLATEPRERGTGKQTVCFSLCTDEGTVLQRLPEDEVVDCVAYYPSKSLTLNDLRTNPAALDRVKFYGQLLHVTFNNDQRNDTKHVRLFISGSFVANESSEGDVLVSSSAPVIQVQHSSRTGIVGCDESTLSTGQLLSMQDLVIERVSPTVLTADGFSKIQVLIPRSTFSTRSSTPALHVDDLWRKMTTVAMDDEKYSHLRKVSRAILPELNEEIESDSLVTFEGIIIDVDQANAFCWFTCNECGSDDISELQENSLYICNSCTLDIRSPVTNTHLEIYLKSVSSPKLRVKAKLLQSTISRLLPVGDNDEGYDVQCVLNRRLGPMSCYVLAKLHDNELDSLEDSQINFKLEELDDSSWTQ